MPHKALGSIVGCPPGGRALPSVGPGKTGFTVAFRNGDKSYLANVHGARLGKAKVAGYCIRFKALKDMDRGVLEAAFRDGAMQVCP